MSYIAGTGRLQIISDLFQAINGGNHSLHSGALAESHQRLCEVHLSPEFHAARCNEIVRAYIAERRAPTEAGRTSPLGAASHKAVAQAMLPFRAQLNRIERKAGMILLLK